ncbi:hypothetical protein BKA56DRAFT_611790 [Ilyonectria sp. MPI-CAGE-AT-0026]|nr:hypothetical protein BKA56DRAFT_611790 [Ilyonectria sp. MPI-CAGE-AT-0026]
MALALTPHLLEVGSVLALLSSIGLASGAVEVHVLCGGLCFLAQSTVVAKLRRREQSKSLSRKVNRLHYTTERKHFAGMADLKSHCQPVPRCACRVSRLLAIMMGDPGRWHNLRLSLSLSTSDRGTAGLKTGLN